MTQINETNQVNYMNGLATGAIGGLAWGAVDYVFKKKPFLQNDYLSDTFVKSLEESFTAIKDKTTLDTINFQKNLETEIDALKSTDEIKKFLTKNKDDIKGFTDEAIESFGKIFDEVNIEDGKAGLKDFFKTKGKYHNYFKQTFDACCDKTGNFVHDAQKISNEKFDIVKKTANKFRRNAAIKSAATFAVICAATCCLFDFIMAKKNSKKQIEK